ncbi:MAG: capsular polysaccharide synthesis protein [Steroidobacteraceae bacterium]
MIPRIIHSLWYQGVSQAPGTVRLCFERWRKLNPGYEVRVLEAADVRRLLHGFPLPLESISMQALSDIVRIHLLAATGGIWTDATVMPIEPLDAWLPEHAEPTGFFAFDAPLPDRPLASWFLAASSPQELMQKWCREVVRFWCKPRTRAAYGGGLIPPDPAWEVAPDGGARRDTYPYFWFHYLFGYLLKEDAEFARLWGQCRRVDALAPLRLQHLFEKGNDPRPQAIAAAARAAPVQKLNWRQPYPLSLLETVASRQPSAPR